MRYLRYIYNSHQSSVHKMHSFLLHTACTVMAWILSLHSRVMFREKHTEYYLQREHMHIIHEATIYEREQNIKSIKRKIASYLYIRN